MSFAQIAFQKENVEKSHRLELKIQNISWICLRRSVGGGLRGRVVGAFRGGEWASPTVFGGSGQASVGEKDLVRI